METLFHIDVDYKDRQQSPNWEARLFADIIFIDKTLPDSSTFVYQMKDIAHSLEESIKLCKGSRKVSSKESFLLLGECASMDRKKKQIILKNQNTISYNYLIIVSGRKLLLAFENSELSAALQALHEALQVKFKVVSNFSYDENCHTYPKSIKNCESLKNYKERKNPTSKSSKNVHELAHPFISSSIFKEGSSELMMMKQRLYQLQL